MLRTTCVDVIRALLAHIVVRQANLTQKNILTIFKVADGGFWRIFTRLYYHVQKIFLN